MYINSVLQHSAKLVSHLSNFTVILQNNLRSKSVKIHRKKFISYFLLYFESLVLTLNLFKRAKYVNAVPITVRMTVKRFYKASYEKPKSAMKMLM